MPSRTRTEFLIVIFFFFWFVFKFVFCITVRTALGSGFERHCLPRVAAGRMFDRGSYCFQLRFYFFSFTESRGTMSTIVSRIIKFAGFRLPGPKSISDRSERLRAPRKTNRPEMARYARRSRERISSVDVLVCSTVETTRGRARCTRTYRCIGNVVRCTLNMVSGELISGELTAGTIGRGYNRSPNKNYFTIVIINYLL